MRKLAFLLIFILILTSLAGAQDMDLATGAKSNFARVLSTPLVSTICLSLGFVGLVLEIFSSKRGPGAILGLAGFGLYFLGGTLSGSAGVMSLALFVLGGILIFAEVILPGFGVPGIAGGLFLVFGILTASRDWVAGVFSLAIAMIIGGGLFYLLLKSGARSAYVDKIILNTSIVEQPLIETEEKDVDLLGLYGISLTPLRPAGTAKIGDRRYDVISEGEFIPIDTEIEVFKIVGRKIFVRRKE